MRLKIDTSTVKFRVAGTARPRQVSRNDPTQKTTPPSDGSRPIWTVRLTAIDTAAGSTEQIFVDVAGEMPQVAIDEIASVQGLVFAPWVNKQGEIMRSFRADAITMADSASRRAA
ncbi:MAG TPA: hypothetical protein VGG54_11215 [Trebonia sp.]|jgi:hypothetical protein